MLHITVRPHVMRVAPRRRSDKHLFLSWCDMTYDEHITDGINAKSTTESSGHEGVRNKSAQQHSVHQKTHKKRPLFVGRLEGQKSNPGTLSTPSTKSYCPSSIGRQIHRAQVRKSAPAIGKQNFTQRNNARVSAYRE